MKISFDACGHRGVQLLSSQGRPLPYCSRFADGGQRSIFILKLYFNSFLSWINYLSLPFDSMLAETFWMFAPKNYEAKFLHYYFLHPQRPQMVVLLLQGLDLPSSLQLCQKYCCEHRMGSPNLLCPLTGSSVHKSGIFDPCRRQSTNSGPIHLLWFIACFLVPCTIINLIF